jgi:enterochelin esterase-like enzyme
VSRVLGAFAAVAVAAAAVSSPVIRGNTATFVVAGNLSDPPRIVGDFNGWSGGAMAPSADGRTFTLTVPLDPAARIEYLIAYRDRFAVDPGNPLTVPAPTGEPRSELRMPRYRPLALPATTTRGAVEEVSFVSRDGQARRVRVYVPHAVGNTLPVLYVHDGDIGISALKLPEMLDSLIAARRIAPALVVFVDAVDRHADYAPGSAFRSVFTNEIVPLVERRYPVARERRALMGLSRSTVGALDACTYSTIVFTACVLLAPAIPPVDFPKVLPPSGSRLRVLIATGTYDIPLVDDARLLRSELERRALRVQYVEAPEGHNHTAFRARLPALLASIFPR